MAENCQKIAVPFSKLDTGYDMRVFQVLCRPKNLNDRLWFCPGLYYKNTYPYDNKLVVLD